MFLTPARAEKPAHFHYPGLPLQPGQIRLIELLPGVWSEPVRCRLFNVRHETAVYQSLSYVWGSQRVNRTIVVNSKSYSTTVNLESALRHLRQRNKNGMVLWVDALCINQGDTEERTRQVQLMGDIYKMCKSVVVYLGDRLEGTTSAHTPPPEVVDFDLANKQIHLTVEGKLKPGQGADTSQVFGFLAYLALDRHLNKVSGLPPDIIPHGEGHARRCETAEIEECRCLVRERQYDQSRLVEGLRKFMHPPFTPWWNRIWVIQEVVAPPSIDIVYGTCSAPWSMLTLAASAHTKHRSQCCSHNYSRLPRDIRKVLEDFSQRITDIDELRSRHKTQYYRVQEPRPDSRSLLELLRRFRDRKASDPRDKIYALLSLVESNQNCFAQPIFPDYALSEAAVFAQATLHCIYTTTSLSVFSTELGRKFRSDLPTWVPDWSAPGSHTYTIRARAVELYDACPSEKCIGDVVNTRGLSYLTLKAQGFEFEKVQNVGDVMWGDEASFCRDTLEKWCYRIPHKKMFMDKPGNKTSQGYWNLICADIIYRPQADRVVRRAVDRDELFFVAWSFQSPRSPFTDLPGTVQDMVWSPIAQVYRTILMLWPTLASADFVLEGQSCLPSWPPSHRSDNKSEHERIMLRQRAQFEKLMALVESSELREFCWLDELGQFRRDAPWREFVDHIVKHLKEIYEVPFGRSLHPEEDDLSAVDDSIMAATLSRRLIVGEHYVGLGPADSKIGDELCFLEGGKTPFVLRRREGKRDEFEMVGDSYVQNMMDDGPARLTRRWRELTLV
jgi:hypothetical protein